MKNFIAGSSACEKYVQKLRRGGRGRGPTTKCPLFHKLKSGHPNVVGRLPVRILETSLSLRGTKEGKDELLTVAPLGEGDSWSNCCPMAATFSVKKEAKLSAVRLVAGGEEEGRAEF